MGIDLSSLDFAQITPQEFARIVKSAKKQDLAALMSGPDRDRVLDEVFDRMAHQFRSDIGGHLDATVRWKLRGDSGTAHEPVTYELTMAGGQCTTRKGSSDVDARSTLTMRDTDFIQLVSGNAGGPMLFMTRKLTVEGDLGLAASLTRYFDIPRA